MDFSLSTLLHESNGDILKATKLEAGSWKTEWILKDVKVWVVGVGFRMWVDGSGWRGEWSWNEYNLLPPTHITLPYTHKKPFYTELNDGSLTAGSHWLVNKEGKRCLETSKSSVSFCYQNKPILFFLLFLVLLLVLLVFLLPFSIE